MTRQSDLVDLIAAGQQREALELALTHRTRWVQDQLRDERVSGLAQSVSTFLQRWMAELEPLERLGAANWAVSFYALDLVHLEHAYRTGAVLYLDAQRSAAGALAQAMRQVAGFSEGPDAALHPDVPLRLEQYARQLEAMSFAPILLTGD